MTAGERMGLTDKGRGPQSTWRTLMDPTASATLLALVLSVLSFYRSYFYINQQLDVTVTEVSYGTNRGELYMTVAFSNGGNRDAAVLRVEPAMWARRAKPEPEWVPVDRTRVPRHPDRRAADAAGRQVGGGGGAHAVDDAESSARRRRRCWHRRAARFSASASRR